MVDEAGSYHERFVAVRRVELDGASIDIEQEAPTLDDGSADPLGTGCTVWSGGDRLVRLLCDDVELRSRCVEGRSVLELGSGTGICGLACAALGAKEVVLTDLADRLALLRRNVARNGWLDALESRAVTVAELAWGGPRFSLLGALSALSGKRRTIVAADVVYAQTQVDGLSATLAEALALSRDYDPIAVVACRKHDPVAYAAFMAQL